MLTAAKLDAHNTPGQKEEIAPATFNGGRIEGGKLLLDIPAKSVVVVKIEG